MTINDLFTPALVLDIDILENNLASMQQRANALGVALRPHVKTHKSLDIARKQKDLGARGITVSTFYEASAFAEAGFDDILWAFPLPLVYIPPVIDIQTRCTLRVLVDGMDAVDALERSAERAGCSVHTWLKVDCGTHRVGVAPKSVMGEEIAARIAGSPFLCFDGLLAHGGHSYGAHNRDEIRRVANEERTSTLEFAERLRAGGITVPAVSIGSTPTATVAEKLSGIAEIRPGNYVFHDYFQASIGTCGLGDCALTVLASVVSHQPGADRFVTDAGALALSKDIGPTHLGIPAGFGVLFDDYEGKTLAPGTRVSSVSQEHGTVQCDYGAPAEGKYKVGDRVRILENHSCLTAAQFDRYAVVKGREVIDTWRILRGRM